MKQVTSPEALKQVKLLASELRASPPKNEASGFGASRFKTEACLNHPWRAIFFDPTIFRRSSSFGPGP